MKFTRIRVALALAGLIVSAMPGRSQVTYDRILKAAQEPQNWLTYSGDYNSWRYSKLDQINPSNAGNLAVQWAFQSSELGQFETTPLVIDGVLYGTGQNNRAFALDARTGRAIWRYQRRLPDKVQACCGMVNRGFAALGDRLFMATLDAHVVALDMKTGNVIWDVEAADYHQAYVFTVAPLVVKDKIIVGVAGGEYGVRGFIDAYYADTGKRAWRFYTVPAAGEPGHETWAGDSWKTGGAPAWITGSYDPELNLIYWPTGNPSPSNSGVERGGDNLYSNSMLALDADTGKLKWHYQFTPHDLHDYDSTQIPVLLDAPWQGQPRKLLLHANRNGFLYVLDRTNGKFLSAKPFFERITWAKEIGSDGRPVLSCPAASPPSKGRERVQAPWALPTGFHLRTVHKRGYCMWPRRRSAMSSPTRLRNITKVMISWGACTCPPAVKKPGERCGPSTRLRARRNGSSNTLLLPTEGASRPPGA